MSLLLSARKTENHRLNGITDRTLDVAFSRFG